MGKSHCLNTKAFINTELYSGWRTPFHNFDVPAKKLNTLALFGNLGKSTGLARSYG